MAVSVEISHSKIINQIISLKKVYDMISCVKKKTSLSERIDLVVKDIENIENFYMSNVGPYMTQFYNTGKCEPYWDFVTHNGILVRLNSCADDIGIVSQYCKIDVEEVDKNTIIIPVKKIGDLCVCGKQMVIDEIMSRKTCCVCGAVERINAMKYVDAMASVSDQICVRSGRHHPSVHCRLWIGRIQAWDTKETKKIDGSGAVDYLRGCIASDGLPVNLVSCRKIREYIKIGGYTKLNNVIPYLRKLATGVVPPQLNIDELDRLYELFDRVVAVLKKLRPNNNITYYPYIIYKVLDCVLLSGVRKGAVLECIHLQTNKTTISIDLIWELICENVAGLKYVPTIS